MIQRRFQVRVSSINNVDDTLTGRTGNSSLVGGTSNDITSRPSKTNTLTSIDIVATKGNIVTSDFNTNNTGAFEIDTIALGTSSPNNAGPNRASSQVSILAMGQASVQLSGQASVQTNGQISIGNASVAISIL